MSLSQLGVAPLAVNGYLWDTIKSIDTTFNKKYGTRIPFFPLGDAASGVKAWEKKAYVVYDRMFKFNRSPFYPIKHEQIIYSVKGNEQDILEWGAAIQIILDRSDDAGKDINNWIRANGGNDEYPIYFHELHVHQTLPQTASSSENIRDISSKPSYIADFFVDMKYHYTKSLEDYL